MRVTGTQSPDSLPSTQAERIDRACDAFKLNWRSGRQPRIETLLAGAPELERPPLLRELMAAELELRLASGETPLAEEYRGRFPGHGAVVAAVFGGAETPHELASATAQGGPDLLSITMPMDASALTETGSPVQKNPAAYPLPGLPSIPGYVLHGELGRGGMGVVYLAREIRLNRPCALKMVRAGNLAGARETSRFLAEAAAAAKLHHPNVVQIYSLGECAGLPYLEMEYVEGGSLADRLDGTPLPPGEASRLVEILARSIGAAHSLGIVHRDLKPANVLLTPDGTPKITDFGLAKAMDSDSGMTGSGEILGTPSYMAPEQAGGRAKQAGPAADVYALGAVLYELLVGRPPFMAATVLETLEQVRVAEPVAPSRLVPRLPRDLETICLKCLQKEPTRRYDSAESLAEDLARYVEGRPILARPIGPARRLWRWCRRNRVVAGLTAIVATLLVASTIGAGLAAYQFRRSAVRERALAAQAEQNLERARQVVEEMYSQVALQLDDQKGMDAYQRDIMQKALRFYEGFALQQSRAPRVRFEAGQANGRVGSIQLKLGRIQEAEAALARSLDILVPLADEHPAVPEYRATLAATLGDLGQVLGDSGRTKEAEGAFERSVAMLRTLSGSHPQVADYQRDLAKVLANQGIVFFRTSRTGQAEEVTRQAVAIYVKLTAAELEVPTNFLELAKARTTLGEIFRGSRRPHEAEAEYREAVTLLERLNSGHPEVTAYQAQLGRVLNNLGELYREARQQDKAEKSHLAALAVREKLAADHPEVVAHQNDVGASHLNLGIIYSHTGRPAEAEAAYRKSAAIRERLSKRDPQVIEYQRYLATAHNNLAAMYANNNRLPEAEVEYLTAISVYERLVQSHPDQIDCAAGLGNSNANLGGILAFMGKNEQGRERLSRGAELLEDVVRRNPEHTETRLFLSGVYFNRAELARAEGRHADALADWERTIPGFIGHPYERAARMGRAVARARLHDHARALAEAEALTRDDGSGNGKPMPAEFFYDAAVIHSLASAAALKEDGPPRPERKATAETHAAAAVALLVRAKQTNYFPAPSDLKGLANDSAFDPLRTRADFRLLVMDIAFPADPIAR